MGSKREGTREKIKKTALSLFSQKGYTAVSVREIGGAVGIKESTLYYHFASKQALFDELLHDFEEFTEALPVQFHRKLGEISRVEKEPFVQVGLAFLNQYLLHEKVLPFLRMLSLEQQVNAGAARLYRKALFDGPLQKDAAVFSFMMEKGLMKRANPESLALAYYAPILLIFEDCFAMGDADEKRKQEANRRLAVYLGDFYEQYIGGNGHEGV